MEYIFWGKILAVLFICGTLFLWIAEKKKNAKIINIRNCQSFVSHSSLPNFLSYGAPLIHVSHYSSAITQRPRHNDGWIANMLLCPYEIESKLSFVLPSMQGKHFSKRRQTDLWSVVWS